MINIPNFDKEFNGKIFKDKTLGTQSDLVCVGYGDNGSNGSPYFVGMYSIPTGAAFKTVLVKNAEFIPSVPNNPAT